jgi:tripartite-type tricarboxylate transporter receptor subunit TctC
MNALARFAIGITFGLHAVLVIAQPYPSKTVTIVVPWPPGGPTDTAARPLAKGLTESLKQTFIVDNRAGASGNSGSAAAARSAPDGHTLLVTSSSPIVINPHLYKKMPLDPAKDLVPITNLLRVPLVLVVHPSVQATKLNDLVAHINSQQGKFQCASSGNGTPQHMTMELFKTTTKVDMVHVPYRGSAPAISDLVGGHVPMMFDSTVAIMPHIKAGKAKPIAVTGAKRSAQLPDVPTFAELGFPAVESYAWYGMFAPARTPNEIVARLNTEALKVMKDPVYTKLLADTGSEFPGDTPENFAAFIKAESAKWAHIVKVSGATMD